MKFWEFHDWTNQEVFEFLAANEWTQSEVLNKIRRGPQHIWLFTAKAAPAQQNRDNDFWYYTDQDKSLRLTIAPAKPRARKAVVVEQVPGPRKRWTDKPAATTVAATQLDLTMDEPQGEPSDQKERPPRRGRENKELDPDKVFLAQFPEWEFADDGGAGDCAFQSAAHCIAVSQGKTLNTEAQTREASRLRVLAIGHMNSNKSHFESFRAQDADEEDKMRNFQPKPEPFADYVLAAGNKGYYADDLLLRPVWFTRIVVFAWSPAREVWDRTVWWPTVLLKVLLKLGKRVFALCSGSHAKQTALPSSVPGSSRNSGAGRMAPRNGNKRQNILGAAKSTTSRLSLPAPSVTSRLSLPSSGAPKRRTSNSASSQPGKKVKKPEAKTSDPPETLKQQILEFCESKSGPPLSYPRISWQNLMLACNQLSRLCNERLEALDLQKSPTLSRATKKRLTARTDSSAGLKHHPRLDTVKANADPNAWSCNFCDFKVYASDRTGLYHKRSSHIKKRHADKSQYSRYGASLGLRDLPPRSSLSATPPAG